METGKIYAENCLDTMARMPDGFVDCVVTSPPYFGLRDYGVDGQIGLEATPADFVAALVAVFTEVRRVLKPEGTLWLNLGDSYSGSNSTKEAAVNPDSLSFNMGQTRGDVSKAIGVVDGLKAKDLIGIPWRVAFALQESGWWLRQDIIWSKPNPMPESVQDRCTKAHEYIFLLTKNAKYYYDSEAIKEPSIDPESYSGRRERNAGQMAGKDLLNYKFAGGIDANGKLPSGKTYETRNKRSVWQINTKSLKDAHFAAFPESLIRPCILAGSRAGGIIYDPFMGAGTTALVSHKMGRQWIGSEISAEYCELANKRLAPYLAQGDLFTQSNADRLVNETDMS